MGWLCFFLAGSVWFGMIWRCLYNVLLLLPIFSGLLKTLGGGGVFEYGLL